MKDKKKIPTWKDLAFSEPISGPMAGGRCRYTISEKEIISRVQGTIHSEMEEGFKKFLKEFEEYKERSLEFLREHHP